MNILIWTDGLDDFLEGKPKFNGGIAVQLSFWARVFVDKGWHVYTFSEYNNYNKWGIEFQFRKKYTGFFGFLFDFISPIFFFLKIRPNLVVFRGASRNLLFLTFWARILQIKLIFMGANDGDFIPGSEIINYQHDKYLYRMGLRLNRYVIVQNDAQRENFARFYNSRAPLAIPNIWYESPEIQDFREPRQYIIWVANFHKLKRPEIYISLAKRIVSERFLMIGGDNDKSLYDECFRLAKNVKNLTFLGGLPFVDTNRHFRSAKILVCTSRTEGFPNTFLQAWSNGIPVISTFDPGGVIEKYGLGLVAKDINELERFTNSLLNDLDLYRALSKNIETYFSSNHDAKSALTKLLRFIACRP